MKFSCNTIKIIKDEVTENVEEIRKMYGMGNKHGIAQKQQVIDPLNDRFAQFLLQQEVKLPMNLSKTKVNTDMEKVKISVGDAVTIDSDLIKVKSEYRLFYFTESLLNFYNMDTNRTHSLHILGMEQAPVKYVPIEVNQSIYLVGGESLSSDSDQYVPSSEVYKVDEAQCKAVRQPSMAFPRSCHSLVSFSKKFGSEYIDQHVIIASGARSQDDVSRSTEYWNLTEKKWEIGPDMNIGRYFHSSVILEERFIYIFCGRDSILNKPIDLIERCDLDQEENSYEAVPIYKSPAWGPRDTVGSIALNESQIMIFGGDIGWLSE